MKPTNDKVRWAVVYGQAEAQEDLQTTGSLYEKSALPLGYGHLDAAPAQVVYKDKDLIILSNKE